MVCVFSEDAMITAECKTSSPPTGDKSDIQENAAEFTHQTDVRHHCAAEYPPVMKILRELAFLGRAGRKAPPGLYIMHSR